MKKKFVGFIAAIMATVIALPLGGCDIFGDFGDGSSASGGSSESGLPQIDNSVDLNEYTPTPDDDNEYIDGETYYTSTSVDLVTEIHGNYTIDRPFTLDETDENKRIYHNIYFYEEDFFQVLYYKDVNGLGSVYAILSDETDTAYAEIEYTPQGASLQINITQEGIYNLVLDIETLAIDMVKVGDIQTPVYEKIRSCELYVHTSLTDYSYSEMTLDEETNEYYIEKQIPRNASIGFFSASHMSRYKTNVVWDIYDTLVYWNSTNVTSIQVHVGGTYNVYFNAKTYELRLELQNPDTASYYCQVGFNQGQELGCVSEDKPYLFEYNFVAQGTATDPYVDIPNFYPELGMKYRLSVINEDGFVANDMYLTESGTYKMTVNLLDFTLTIEKIS